MFMLVCIESYDSSFIGYHIIASHTWITPNVRGDGPEAREGHGAALVGKRLFIYGGCGKSSDNYHEVYYEDLYILNTGNFLHQQVLVMIML